MPPALPGCPADGGASSTVAASPAGVAGGASTVAGAAAAGASALADTGAAGAGAGADTGAGATALVLVDADEGARAGVGTRAATRL